MVFFHHFFRFFKFNKAKKINKKSDWSPCVTSSPAWCMSEYNRTRPCLYSPTQNITWQELEKYENRASYFSTGTNLYNNIIYATHTVIGFNLQFMSYSITVIPYLFKF